jgi:GAF domain-containing protein
MCLYCKDEAVIGVLSMEHVGSAPNHWNVEDKNFAKAVADQIALTMERRKRADVEAKLTESQRTLTALMNHLARYGLPLSQRSKLDHGICEQWRKRR